MLIRIVAPHFVAGLILVNDQITRCAPIVAYMKLKQWDPFTIALYCQKKNWQFEIID